MNHQEMIAVATDLNVNIGRRAYEWTSFSPEKRALSDIESYLAAVNGLHSELLAIAETEEQRTIAREQVERYKTKYIDHQNVMWGAKSRTASPMITGPARFPVERNRKRMETCDKRISEFLDWNEKARAAALKAVLAARSPEQVADADWSSLKDRIDWSMNVGGSRTNVQGILERLAANGKVDLVKKALDHIREAQATMSKPFFTARNSLWSLAEVAQAAAEKDKPTGTTLIVEGPGFRVINNRDAERVQIYFEAIPDPALRDKLKGSGWRWSPSNGCWQRQNTANGISNVRYVLASLLPTAA